eukprot:3577592-Rhodomonas_salina.3
MSTGIPESPVLTSAYLSTKSWAAWYDVGVRGRTLLGTDAGVWGRKRRPEARLFGTDVSLRRYQLGTIVGERENKKARY